ncbi:hypothetical protein REPUB_Repub06bG0142300 [Reevesia pubescens]
MELKHFSHEHPLGLLDLQEQEEGAGWCFFCKERVKGPSYGCSGCEFYLHKTCAELGLPPQINHLFHPSHPLILLPKSPYSGNYSCNFCGGRFWGLVYHCASCDFHLDINCALLQLYINAGNFDKLEHFSHQHPLIFNEKYNKRVDGYCQACRKNLSGSTPIYRCLDCSDFDLHKECTELSREINHPFHPQHPLILLTKLPSSSTHICHFCRSICRGFVYSCDLCNFKLDVDCALDQLSIAANFPKLKHSAHEHPLIFIEKPIKTITEDCFGCKNELSGPIYKCFDCYYFHLHKKCAELSPQIDHPYDRKHPLTLLHNPPPTHPERCSCNLCKIEWTGFVYYCSFCEFGLTLDEVWSSRTIPGESHEHPFTLLSRPISFTCDFCGTDGDRTPYLCTTCDLIVHKKCISLPPRIRIMRHYHPLSHIYSLRKNQSEEWECRICHEEVNTGFGSYYCSDSNCNYIAHVNCATHGSIWDGSSVLEDEDEESEGESMSLITDVIQTMCVGENVMAIEIKHGYHNHNLILTSSGDVEDDSNCDGCMRPISVPFYGCKQFCGFLLHKSCAELPRKKRHPSHKHILTLTENKFEYCDACCRDHHGFSYKCNKGPCEFKIDIQCSLLADTDTLRHPSHEHPLFLDHNYEGNCSACSKKTVQYSCKPSVQFRCMRGCKFILDFSCLTLPQMAWYKYDKHLLTLTYRDDSDPNQAYCDICEEERDPKHWFYNCADCDTTVHPECIFGDIPFIKLGKTERHGDHPHPLTFVKKIWNCPRCNICNKLCYGHAIECKESECNFIIHWGCHKSLEEALRIQRLFKVWWK